MNDLPQSFTTGITRWQVRIHQTDHFRAERRPTLRQANTEQKALLGCGLLIVLGGTVAALSIGGMGLGATFRLLRTGPHPTTLREALIYSAIALGWFGLLYALVPKV